MARIPDWLKEQIKSKNSLVEIASEYTVLKPQGHLMIGKCPFPHGGTDKEPHYESDASFTIYPNNTFYCYGCGKGTRDGGDLGSDVIAFVREIEGIGYKEACKALAERADIQFNIELTQENSDLTQKIQAVTELNRTFYRNLWERNLSLAEQIAQERGIDANWLKENARIGLVPSDYNWEVLRDRIAFGIAEMVKCKKPRTIAMAYRHPDSILPKWINDKGSVIFDKKSTLYMFSTAYKSIKKMGFAITVEGYWDVLSAHYKELTNTVGYMGRSFTDEQMDILRKETDTLAMWPDGDNAGIGTMESSILRLLNKGFKVLWIRTPGQDPDEALRNLTAEEAHQLIKKNSCLAVTGLIQHYSDLHAKEVAICGASAELIEIHKARVIDKLIPILKAIKSPGELACHIDYLGKTLNIQANTIMFAMSKCV